MAFKHYPQISKEDIPSMNIENVNAYLRDFSINEFIYDFDNCIYKHRYGW